MCDTYRAVVKRKNTMTEVLKKAILDSGMSYLALQDETGVQRGSIMRFMRGETSLRLDIADTLAEHFGIEACVPRSKR